MILDESGLIMTNAHVVNKANKVSVTLTDGRTFEGIVKGSDDYMDLASVKTKIHVLVNVLKVFTVLKGAPKRMKKPAEVHLTIVQRAAARRSPA